MSESEKQVEELLNNAAGHHIRKEYEKAIKCCQEALEIDPNNDRAYYKLGLNYFEQKNQLLSICSLVITRLEKKVSWLKDKILSLRKR